MSGMEAALASGLLKVASNRLLTLIAKELHSIKGVTKDLSELGILLEEISSWLIKAQERAVDSELPLGWVIKLKNVAYDIDDLLDEVSLKAEKHNIDSSGDKHAVVDCFCAKPKKFMFRCKVSHKIKAIKLRLAEIVKQRSDMNTMLPALPVNEPVPSKSTATDELYLLGNTDESKIPIRDQEKDEIISKLVEFNERDNFLIVSIVGIGGSGKTTLAKNICHDEKIKEHFRDEIFRVHVSREFDADRLIGKLFEAITKQSSHTHPLPQKLHVIFDKITNKKFLLVLDDAWHKNILDWEKFLLQFKSSFPGSRVLLTTRDQKVAEAVGSWYTHNMVFLSETESWDFFIKISGWTPDEGSELTQEGKEIVKKCGGVPLAIKILGGVFRGRTETDIWSSIRGRRNLWNDENTEDQVFACLKFSYFHLENHLKQCFTFCSIFPKGYEIQKEHLIGQWIAHGFVISQYPDQLLVGSEYFDSLVNVGFLQDSLESYYDVNFIVPTRTYKMHDLIHDLAQKILQHEVVAFPLENRTTDFTLRCRYLSVTQCTENIEWRLVEKGRALFVSDGDIKFTKPVKKSTSIRSAVLDYTMCAPFPQFILKFEHLGYLEMRNVCFTEFPEAMSGCWNLQSLYFTSCKGFVTLPESVGRLKKLRVLGLALNTDLESLPQSIGDCQHLESLDLHECEKFRELPSNIGKIKNLRALHIFRCLCLEQLPSQFIGEFSSLQTIKLDCCWHFQDLPSTFSCETLRILDLSNTKVMVLPQWVTTIGSLECINLDSCAELVELPKGIGNLKRLTVFNLKGCWKVRCIPSGLGQLTCLSKLGLFVVGCGTDDARISELENLDMLSGYMAVTNLQFLKDLDDAKKACLKRKSNIRRLELRWTSTETEELLSLDMEQEQAVLNSLEPPSEVQTLTIRGYRGTCLPWWMMKESSPCQFLSLTELILMDIPNLKHMGGLSILPSLKHLGLHKVANLEELWTMTCGTKTGEYCFPVLSSVRIQGCPELNVKPYFPPSLEDLCLDKSNLQLLSPGSFADPLRPPIDESTPSSSENLVVRRLRGLTLTGIRMSSFGQDFLLQEQHCTELVTLGIKCFEGLKELLESIDGCHSIGAYPKLLEGIKCFEDLKELLESIDGCHSIGAYPKLLEGIKCFEDLKELLESIDRCPSIGVVPPKLLEELRSLPYVSDTAMIDSVFQSTSTEHLMSLGVTKLTITSWHYLKKLPEAIQQLTSLEELDLSNCNSLAVLPEGIGQLSALRRLWIQYCPALECLPQSIQRLTSLKDLFIFKCPHLARLYKKNVGPEWHLVSHIPSVCIEDWPHVSHIPSVRIED